MEQFMDDDEFVQFILTEYLPTPDINNDQKLQQVFESEDTFNLAIERFLQSSGIIGIH